jgi:hypothetical protein
MTTGDTINIVNPTYQAIVDSLTLFPLVAYNDPLQSLHNLRVFNYNSKPNYNLPLRIDSKNIILNLSNKYNTFNVHSRYDSTGVIAYGDGTAQGTASFLNGLVYSSGQYLDTTGQPSGYDKLQNADYNSFTYQITLEKEISKYRDILLNLLHPTGMKMLGRYTLESQTVYNSRTVEALFTGLTLQDYTGYPGSTVTMNSNFTNISNNIVQFNNLAGANLATFITVGVPGTANSIL